MGAEAAPLEGPGISLTLGLWILVGLLVAMGVRVVWENTLGAVLKAVGNALNGKILGIHVGIGGPFLKADSGIQQSLGDYILLNEKALGLWFHANKSIVEYLGNSIGDFGLFMHKAVGNLVDGVIPGRVDAATKPIARATHTATHTAQVRDRAEAHARSKGIDAVHRDLTAEKLARERGIDNVNARTRGYVDTAVDRVGGQIAAERRYAHKVLGGRLSLLEKLLGVGAIGGIALATLTRVFPYWQCSNFRRFAKGVCRSPLGALDWLFALAGLALIALDPVEMEHLAEDAADLLEGIIREMAGV